MLMVQRDLIKPYSDGVFAFKLIESMMQMDPSKRPTVGKVLDSEFFLMFRRTRTGGASNPEAWKF